MFARRIILAGIAGTACLAATRVAVSAQPSTPDPVSRLSSALGDIEIASRGRLGVAILDTESGVEADHRGSERFPLCSTFKLLASAAVLARVDRGEESLDRRIRFEKADLVQNSPITQHHVGAPGMTLRDVCQAALNYSDNTAGNLLLRTLGGPPGLTGYARSLGDTVTRLDRWETALNEALPGDPRDTTTPIAMRDDLQKLVLGEALSQGSRDNLETWLLNCKTSDTRIKARLPAGWRVGDKTGNGERGSTNDIGLIWRPNRKPIIFIVYQTNTDAGPAQRDGTIASVGQLISEVFP